MSEKKSIISIVSLPQQGQHQPAPYVIASLCNMDRTAFEHQQEAHRHDFYSIYWIKKGKLIHTIDTVAHEVTKNTLFFIAPGQVHKMEFRGRVNGIMMAFDDAFLCLKDEFQSIGINSELFFNEHFSSVVPLNDQQARELEGVVALMMKEAVHKQVQHSTAFHSLLRYFLVLVSRIKLGQDQLAYEPNLHTEHNGHLFLKFKTLIEKKFIELKKVSDYAVLLHIKPVLLNEICKQLSGITAGEHIRSRIILEAKRYLHNTDLTAKEIAYQLGFEDPHYFSRFFKKYTGQTPLEFKSLSRTNHRPIGQ